MITRTALFVVAFTASVVVGRATILPETGLALFWPPAGVAVLWGLYAASRREVNIATGFVFLVAAVGNGWTGMPVTTAFFLGLANAVFVVAVRAVMVGDPARRWWHDLRPAALSSLTDIYRFLAASAVAVTLSTILGMTGLALSTTDVTWETTLSWVVRNGAAVVVISAPGLAVRGTALRSSGRALLRAAPLFAFTVALLWVVFGPGRTLPLSFLPLALLFWAGLRLPLPLAAAEGVLGAFTTLYLVRGFGGGQFGTIDDPLAFAVTLQSYMLLAVGLPVVVATVQRERDGLLGELARAARYSGTQADDLRVITETIPDAVVVIDRAGAVLLHNDAAGQWLGDGESFFEPTTFVARRPDGSVMPDDEQPSVRALAGENVRGSLVLSEDRYSGEHRLVAIDAVPMHGGDGPVDRVLLVFHDVSDEQARLHALEAERQRTERLISDAPHGVAVLDLRGRVLQVNDSLAALAGRTVEDVVGMDFGDLSPTHRDKMSVYLQRAVAFPGELLVGDWTIESLDGTDAHVSLTSRVLSSPDEDDEVILVNVVDFSERRRYEERLTYLADHDALTAMPNRRRFDETLEEHLRLCARRGPSGALLLLDLDNFKEVNDTMGHTAGDELIVSISTVVRDSLRGGDLVARLGGDEFAVLLPDADQAGAEAVARMLVERVRAHCQSLDGAKRRVTVSVGAVTFAAAAQQAVDPLALADMLLYDAKEAGRNQHAVLDPSGTEQPRSGARLEWMARIESAIENDAFELYLQPILDVRSNRIVAAEALLRLVDREGQPVSPGRFVHVAERAGLAPELDKWVIRHAVATLSRLHEYAPELVLEVNLSGHSIGDESVEREFVEALHRHGVAPHKFVVEATETAAVADVPAARAFSQRLGAMGTRVAIDDFGAGFGSFYYLKHLPFDIVKIDGEFVAGAHTSAVDRAILRSIVGVARNLGKETVAEFVAEAAVLDVVRELGVDYAQGYYIGEPVPFDTFVSRHLDGGTSSWTTSGSLAADSPSALLVGGDLA